AVILGTVLLSGITSWYRPALAPGSLEYFTYSRAFLALFAALELFAVVTFRVAIRGLLRSASLHAGNLQRILVVGAGELGTDIAEKLVAHRDFGVEVIGFLDDDPAKRDLFPVGLPVLGETAELQRVIDENRIDQVFIALPLEAHKKMMQVLQTVGSECVEVKLVPDILQYATIKATLEELDGTPIINLSQVPLQGWHSLVKRVLDLTFSAAGLLVLAHFLPFVALAIWIEDRGPIFYSQERMGLDGRPFMIWKLRSMRRNAEASTGPVWAVEDDPRRTRFGSFLRRWSIDELPQLWNVLLGDMSLVGPRPPLPSEVAQYSLRDRGRLGAAPGITGIWQVSGRSEIPFPRQVEMDLDYIHRQSLAGDVRLLLKTVPALVRGRGAY
ncbi:MAG: sugar transferase, partial [Burkholderiales bacterium]|nr:sugar transferase [Burkholderiales bacterium]